MWFLYQVLGAICVIYSQAAGRIYGFTLKPYLIYVGFAICVTGWIFPLSFSIAPSFLQAYFVQLGSLCIFGFLTSLYYFKEVLPWFNYLGAVLIIIGACLLVK